MSHITPQDPARATGKVKALFDGVQAKLGTVPNLFRVLGTAPAALEGYLNFGNALAGGGLGAKVREQIALTVAESNMCGYCPSAHAFLGAKVGLSATEIRDARQAAATADHVDAILKLALNILTNYLNHVARTVVDFPEVVPGVEAEPATATCH